MATSAGDGYVDGQRSKLSSGPSLIQLFPPPPPSIRAADRKSPKSLPAGMENDRVVNDLWGKTDTPAVVSNPSAENEVVGPCEMPVAESWVVLGAWLPNFAPSLL